MTKPQKPFSLTDDRFDQSDYWGRFYTILNVIDPRTLFITAGQRQTYSKLLDDFKNKQLAKDVTDEDLWYARKALDSCTHPGTGEVINPLWRMSAFVPWNIPICLGMLTSTSVPGTIFFQWLNQSYNSAVNYANRSGAEMTTSQIGSSYAIATTTACSLGMGLRHLVNNGPLPLRRMNALAPGLVPYIAVGAAGSANVYFTRRAEIQAGIEIFDEDGELLGLSKEAASLSIRKTIISRSLGLPIPVIFVPGLVMGALVRTGKVTNPRAKILCELGLISACISVALPAALAVFPQRLPLPTTDVEKGESNRYSLRE